jgi:type IV pilus assembly protein PilV
VVHLMRASVVTAGRSSGFSLVEVMVAVVVICVGLLGIAKMQSLAMSSTNAARMRSLAALEAASLASAMHANRSYWAGANNSGITPPAVITYAPGAGITGIGSYAAGNTCNQCTSTQIAEYDFGNWINNLAVPPSGVLPGASATVTCNSATPPVNCTITITWTENPVAMSQQEAQQSATTPLAGFNNPTYTLDVEP